MSFIILASSYSSGFVILHRRIIFMFVLQFLNWNTLNCVLILMVTKSNNHHRRSTD